MSYFRKKDGIDPEEEKRRNIESALSIKFHSELRNNLKDFLEDIAMKIETRRYNISMLFMAHYYYSSMRYSLYCDEHKKDGKILPDAGFMSIIVNKLMKEERVKRWHMSFSKVKSYTLRNFCYDIAYNIVIVASEINSTIVNHDVYDLLPTDDDEFDL